MAHFAKLDESNNVVKVVCVGNDIETAAGPLGENDMHVDGETWCQNFYGGGTWKQTSWSKSFRGWYAGEGCVYLPDLDVFTKPRPYESWSLNTSSAEWEPPIAYPSVTTGTLDGVEYNYRYWWDEPNQCWKAHLGQANIYQWNTTTESWDLIATE
tara:strand:+ start:1129 stop:1593 length:465 start_codon:yes stop_codon:yes gene_type:complete